MYLCYYSIFGPHRKFATTQNFHPTGRTTNDHNGIQYEPCLHRIVHIFVQTYPILGTNFFKKLFFRKTDCCNIAVSSTSRRTVVALGKRIAAALIPQNRRRDMYIERTKPTCPTTVFFFSAGQIRFKYFRITAVGYLLFSNLPNIFFE